MERGLKNSLEIAVLTIGIAWGIVSFLLGLAASFTLNGTRLAESLALLVFGFLIVLPVSIAAFWRPRIAAYLLGISFLAVELFGWTTDGLHGAYLVGKKLALPNLLLTCGYAYLAYARRN